MDPKNLARKRLMTADDLFNAAETPLRPTHHRRAHSDTAFLVDDLLLLDPSDLDFSSLDLPPTPAAPRVAPAPVDSSSVSDDSESNGGHRNPRPNPIKHLRSLSVDSDFFDGLTLTDGGGVDIKTASFEVGEFDVGIKKAMGPDKLAELSLIDPKRAKRILANRQSAARSKERKVRYTNELERKVQTLQTEATTLSTQVTMLQRDTTGLTTENKELKLRLQAMEQQAKLKNALNDALKEEVQRLKIATGQIPAVNGNPFNMIPRFPSHQPTMHHFGGQPNQQQQLHMPQSSNNGQHHPSPSNFG